MFRNGLHRKIERILQQSPRAVENRSYNHEARYGVNPKFSGPEYREPGDNHPERNARVCGQVQKGSANVQIRFPARKEKPSAHAINDNSSYCEPNHNLALHLLWIAEPPNRFPADRAHRGEQQDGVGQCSEN